MEFLSKTVSRTFNENIQVCNFYSFHVPNTNVYIYYHSFWTLEANSDLSLKSSSSGPVHCILVARMCPSYTVWLKKAENQYLRENLSLNSSKNEDRRLLSLLLDSKLYLCHMQWLSLLEYDLKAPLWTLAVFSSKSWKEGLVVC